MGRPNPQRAGRLSLKLWALMLDRPASCATLVISSWPSTFGFGRECARSLPPHQRGSAEMIGPPRSDRFVSTDHTRTSSPSPAASRRAP